MRTSQLIMSLLALTASASALAVPSLDGALPVPEPETLALLGVGAIALFIARFRNRK